MISSSQRCDRRSDSGGEIHHEAGDFGIGAHGVDIRQVLGPEVAEQQARGGEVQFVGWQHGLFSGWAMAARR